MERLLLVAIKKADQCKKLEYRIVCTLNHALLNYIADWSHRIFLLDLKKNVDMLELLVYRTTS